MVDWETFYGSFRRPDFIPGFEIQNHLGGGAFGEVYKATKTSIGKAYAIKFLRLDEESARDAIERELEQVRLFAAIDHPNLVTMEDMGVALGVPYLVMGYAGEETLAGRLKKGDLTREDVMRYFVQACRGVLALHDRRLAHFDLKPSNIFLRGDVARVGDYGLAKLLVEGRQTLSFGRGTPQYMAPEMLKNRADHRADLYSLGVILYECVSGELPFAEDRALGIAVREEDVPPTFADDFPQELTPVVTRLLRLDPDDRYPDVPELLEALGQKPRPSDSVRLRHDELPEETRRLQEESRESPRDGDLKQAAAELARGAVGVARSVWDGVVERVSSTEPLEPKQPGPVVDALDTARERASRQTGKTPRPGSGSPSDVIAVATLEDDGEDPSPEEIEAAAHAAVLSSPETPWRQELRRQREVIERGGSPVLASGVPAVPSPVTVPVPPRAEGGLIGNVLQSLVVGGEIMGALVTGPVLVGLRGIARSFDRVLGGVPGILGSLLRFGLMLLLMSLLGGLVAFAFLAALAL